jgi:hypothetical protein
VPIPLWYSALLFTVLADLTLRETSKYHKTVCYASRSSTVYLNCSTSQSEPDVIAISSITAVTKPLGSHCVSNTSCCGSNQTGDCVFTYSGKNTELYQACMGRKETCSHLVSIPQIPTPQHCLHNGFYPRNIDYVQVQYYCINRKLIICTIMQSCIILPWYYNWYCKWFLILQWFFKDLIQDLSVTIV